MQNISPLGYKLLSPEMLKAIMGEVPQQDIDPFELELVESQLERYGIMPGLKELGGEFTEDFAVPALQGANIAEHFEAIAKQLTDKAEPGIACLLSGTEFANLQEHAPPADVMLANINKGWTRFTQDEQGEWLAECVPHPIEDGIVEDKETYVKGSPFSMPIISTAIAPIGANAFANYLWLSPQFVDAIEQVKLEKLGLSSPESRREFDAQKALLEELVPIGKGKYIVNHNSAFDNARNEERFEFSRTPANFVFCTQSAHQVVAGLDSDQRWKIAKNISSAGAYGSLKNLIDVHNFHVPVGIHPKLSKTKKETRNIFVDCDLWEIASQLEETLSYAMDDVYITYRAWRQLWPKYLYFAPSKVVLAAHYLLASSLLPIEHDFYDWKAKVEQACADAEAEMGKLFSELADDALQTWLDNEQNIALLPFGWQKLDWTIKGTDSLGRPIPAWYINSSGGKALSGKKTDAHYLLMLNWLGYPVFKTKESGWCYNDADGMLCKVPHKNADPKSNVGCILTKDYIMHIESGTLTSDAGDVAARVMELMRLRSYWISTGDRVNGLAIRPTQNPVTGGRMLACAPFVVPHNTVSLRTGEPTFLTLAAHTTPKYGSELKAKIKAPEACRIVSFDTDSQELQFLGAYGDSYAGLSGSTPLGSALLVGSKEKGNDVHTITAKNAGVCRDAGKQSIYGICYGGGVKAVSNTIMLWHPEKSLTEAQQFAKGLIKVYKGFCPKGSTKYLGGQASQSFNKMADILSADEPRTTMLRTAMSKAQWPSITGQVSSPATLNWCVQSAGAAYMHCLLIGKWWLDEMNDTQSWLGVTMHDEFVYLSSQRDAIQSAKHCQIAHMWCWSLAHYTLGLYDMPAIRAYASGISVDRIWRKEPKYLVQTPTYNGWGSQNKGKSLAMQDILKHAK